MEYKPTYGEEEAIELVKDEVGNWENQESFVTDKVAFMMSNVVKKCRKNYFGILDNPVDTATNRKKIFVPLTEYLVEQIVKSIDIDTKDIRVYAKNPGAIGIASIFRYVLKYYLDKIGFGKILNTVIRLTAIDGTCFVKTWKSGNDLKMRVIDRLNVMVDPSVNDLSETPIIERHIVTLPEFRKMARENKWKNAEYVEGRDVIDRTGFDNMNQGAPTSEVPMVELFERYGWTPKCVLTGNEADEDEFFYGVTVVSNAKDNPICHLVKEVKDHPYVAFKYKDIWNRFDGRGVAEMVISLQAYINEVVNTRMNTARIAQLGLFKLRGGVTPQQFSKLFSTSAIKLKGQRDDIEKMDTGTVDPSSYKDEEVARGWATDLTGAFDQGEVTASTPATNALVQERGSKQGFNLVQENLGFSIEELIEKKIIPIVNKILTKGSVIRITGNAADFDKIQGKLIGNYVYANADKAIKSGQFITEDMIDEEIIRLYTELKSQGNNRFLTVDEPFDADFDINVEIKDEEVNPALIAQSLTQALGIAAQYPGSRINVDEVIREVFDTLGLDGERFIQSQETLGDAQAQQAEQEQMAQMGGVGQAPNEASLNPTPASRPVV